MDTRFITRTPIAHRGLHDRTAGAVENTASAFEAAARAGYAIELDVQLSADGVAMVFHDEELDRLTGETGPLSGRSAEELAAIGVTGGPDRIDTLAQVLAQVAGRVPVIIEMKDNPGRNHILAGAVARDLGAYAGEAAVMSFSHELLGAFRGTGSPFPLGLTAEGIGAVALAEHDKALAFGIGFVSYHVKALPNAFVARCRAEGLPVITWTVRTPGDVALTLAHADQMTFEGFLPPVA